MRLMEVLLMLGVVALLVAVLLLPAKNHQYTAVGGVGEVRVGRNGLQQMMFEHDNGELSVIQLCAFPEAPVWTGMHVQITVQEGKECDRIIGAKKRY